MLCDVVRRRRRWAYAPVIHAASHFHQKERAAWGPISMYTCGPVSIIMELRLVTLSGRQSSAIEAQSFWETYSQF